MRCIPTLALTTLLAAPALAGDPITLESLLKEMVDREAITRFPDPAYTCRQFSSYDRASTTPDDPKTWFANGDADKYLRVEEVKTNDGRTRKEWVMADMDGPGAVVRIWSANPKGTLRIYLDGDPKPVVEVPMADALGCKWKPSWTLSHEVSRGWNLYLPIPYARRCKITSDENGFYYQVNYRTYAPGTQVETMTPAILDAAEPTMIATQAVLESPGFWKDTNRAFRTSPIEPGATHTIFSSDQGPGAIGNLVIKLEPENLAAALRSTILTAEFDGQQSIWCPLGDFFDQASGPAEALDFYRKAEGGFMQSLFVMPYAKTARIALTNLGKETIHVGQVVLNYRGEPFWTDRSMHFHATWRAEYPIHAYGARGTMDWNYVEIQGQGVYVGDSLAVMNPVPEWWGEGDEKIYVDGETFPSHFGTGTEDYYGYAWCSPVPFRHPFHSQPRCDGHPYANNWGHTTVSRVRTLDAIPFTRSLKFDMEVWHWKECDVAYAATTFFYARPGATTNRKPDPETASKPIPQPPPLPPPFTIEGAIECETMKVLAKPEGLTVVQQNLRPIARNKWSNERHLWIQGRAPGDFVEVEIPVPAELAGAPVRVTLHATKSWDYGIVQFSINGQPAGAPHDLYSGGPGKCIPSGPIDLGVATPRDGRLILRAEVTGGNDRAEGTRAFFGLDCVVLTPEP